MNFKIFLSSLAFLSVAACSDDNEPTPPPTDPVPLNAYYVRTDGGTATQCNGLHDKPYKPDTDSNCAWQNPMIALPNSGPSKIKAGDTLVIKSGDYRIGYGASGSVNCQQAYPYECTMQPLPSGVKIYGEGYGSGCANPPKLIGVHRLSQVLNLSGSNGVELNCLEITDKESCVEFHCHGGNCKTVARCNRDSWPYGDWASTGIVAKDSHDVTIKNVNIHGLAHTGIKAGRISNWLIENSKIKTNGWSGWDGDIGTDSSNAGTIIFRNVEIAWNGCVENKLDGYAFGCWAQQTGGYGDGIGTAKTSGEWRFENVNIHHNTSDGLDLLYTDGTTKVLVADSRFEANAGNQIKIKGSSSILRSKIIGTCAYWKDSYNMVSGDVCRAAGNTISIAPTENSEILIDKNEVTGEGDCMLLTSGGPRTAVLKVSNNFFDAKPDFTSGGTEQTCGYWKDNSSETVSFERNAWMDPKYNAFYELICGGTNTCAVP
jgi:hypothetical protein